MSFTGLNLMRFLARSVLVGPSDAADVVLDAMVGVSASLGTASVRDGRVGIVAEVGGDTDVRPVRLARSCRIAAALVVVALGAGACGSPNDGVGAELDELRAQVDELETQLAEISTTTAVLETTTTPATTTTTLPATTTTTDVTIEYADPATIRVFGAEVGRDMIGRRLFEQELVAMVAAMHAQQRAAFLVGQSFDLEARMILYLADRFVEEIEALRRRGQVIAACEGPLGNHPDMRDTCAGLRP